MIPRGLPRGDSFGITVRAHSESNGWWDGTEETCNINESGHPIYVQYIVYGPKLFAGPLYDKFLTYQDVDNQRFLFLETEMDCLYREGFYDAKVMGDISSQYNCVSWSIDLTLVCQ